MVRGSSHLGDFSKQRYDSMMRELSQLGGVVQSSKDIFSMNADELRNYASDKNASDNAFHRKVYEIFKYVAGDDKDVAFNDNQQTISYSLHKFRDGIKMSDRHGKEYAYGEGVSVIIDPANKGIRIRHSTYTPIRRDTKTGVFVRYDHGTIGDDAIFTDIMQAYKYAKRMNSEILRKSNRR